MLKWGSTLIFTLLLIYADTLPFAGLAPAGKTALLVFLWAVILWITRPIPEYLSAIIAVAVLLLLKTAPAGLVLSGFNSPVWWMVVFACMLGVTITLTGLGKRLAYFVLSKIGTNMLGVMYATTFTNNFLAPFTPSNTARGAIMFGVVEGICESMGFKPGEKKGDHTLMLANMYINTTNTNMFLTAMGGNAIAVSIIMEMTGKTVTWNDWFIAAFVPGIPVILALPYIIYKMFPPSAADAKIDTSYARCKLSEMGPMSRAEKATLVIMLTTLCLWATELWHKVPSTSISFIMACALLFPRFGALEWKDIESKIPWSMLIWLGFAMSLAGVVDKTKGFQWLIDAFFVKAPFLADVSFVSFLMVLLVGIIFLHIMFSGMNAMMMIIVPIAISLAKVKGFDPFSTGLAAALAVSTAAFFLPFNSAPNLIFISSGRYDVKQHLLGAIPLAILIVLSLLFALFVWWPIIGLVK